MTTSKTAYTIDYAVTVTLLPKLFKFDPVEQYINTVSILQDKLNQYGEAVIIPELTPNNYNIHYHCIMKLRYNKSMKGKPLEYVIKNIFRGSKYFGHTVVKKVENHDGWMRYMFKDLPETLRILDFKLHERTLIERYIGYISDKSIIDIQLDEVTYNKTKEYLYFKECAKVPSVSEKL